MKQFIPAPLRRQIRNSLRGDDLPSLAARHGTDKWGSHWYARHYDFHFTPFRRRRMNVLEIGVGGYRDAASGGQSLRMWRDYFPNAHIYSLDIYDKSALQEERITIFQGSQNDPEFLRGIMARVGGADIIVDDGSHVSEHVITSFRTLFPLLNDGGIYAIEDLQTSYWESYGGSEDPAADHTSIAMLKRLIDGLNWEELSHRPEQPLDRCISSLHFYHNLAFIYKGRNEEGSNRTPEQRAVTPRTEMPARPQSLGAKT